jgi:nucleoside-diphosphate-sugar epimerase
VRLLVLGGTHFLGRHLVEAALAAGDDVTIFHRGRTNPDLFAGQVARIRGDRDGGLGALAGGEWDAVVDTCGYVPRVVAASARALADRCGHYTFVSSESVYGDVGAPGLDESAPVAGVDDPATEVVDGETYGGLKALCEAAAEAALPGRVLNVRPGLIVGPWDPSDRFTYWPRRIAAGGDVLLPGGPERPVQFIDARDLAAWMLAAARRRLTGTYNACGPALPTGMGALFEACVRVSGSGARPVWAGEAELIEAGVEPWSELPLWVGEGADPANAGFMQISSARAMAAGLAFRPIDDIVRDTLDWDSEHPQFRSEAALAPEREADLLAGLRG